MFNYPLLRQLALDLIPCSAELESDYRTVEFKSSLPVEEHIKPVWISRLIKCMNTLSQNQNGKLLTSHAKQEIIKREAAFRIIMLTKQFSPRELYEDVVFNADETQFVTHLAQKLILKEARSYTGAIL